MDSLHYACVYFTVLVLSYSGKVLRQAGPRLASGRASNRGTVALPVHTRTRMCATIYVCTYLCKYECVHVRLHVSII